MSDLPVLNREGKKVGTVSLREDIFARPATDHLVWEVVTHYLASRRVGTANTKNRIEVRGGGRKPWRQKGTGRARVGSIRTPLWKGGGVVFGPQPRDYRTGLPKKKRRVALRRVLGDMVREDLVLVLEDLNLETHKTRDLVGLLRSVGAPRRTLVVDDGGQRNLLLASRNIPGVTVRRPADLNALDLLLHEHMTISKSALQTLEEAVAP
jgi:large subunit ribosomal protein L4